MPIARPAGFNPELQIKIWETEFARDTIPDDIFSFMSGTVNMAGGKKQPTIPNAVYLKINADKPKGAYEVTVPLLKSLSADPGLGSDYDPRGNEEDYKTKAWSIQYTDVCHATTNQAYGHTALDSFPYDLFKQRVPLLTEYFQQYRGKENQQAIIEGQSENLLEAPVYNNAQLNPNWMVPNVSEANQPEYNKSYVSFVNSVIHSLAEADISDDNAAISVEFAQKLEERAFNGFQGKNRIKPLKLPDGMDGYVWVIPYPQYRLLMHPERVRSLGKIWRDTSKFEGQKEMWYPSAVGMLSRLLIVPNLNYPTLTPGGAPSRSGSGSGSHGTLSLAYRGMGDADDGSSDPRDFSSAAWQMGYLLGAQALCEWMPEKFHWEFEFEQYDKYYGSGLFMSHGIKAPWFDIKTKTNSSIQNMGSIVTPFAPPPATSYSA
jgi:hypothetical protein